MKRLPGLVERLRSWNHRPRLTKHGAAIRRRLVGGGDAVVRGLFAGLGPVELRAILRGEPPTERPNPRYRAQVKSFLLHMRPRSYRRASTWFRHTWRLGWLSVYFFVVEVITGLLLMAFYAPTPERAYDDMVILLSQVPFGSLVRDVHRLAAEGMVLAVALHMVRVFLTASYKGRRRFTWFTGVFLLLVTLGASFTGYLLPWDQLSYWAVTIGTSMVHAVPLVGERLTILLRGGQEIWREGLLRFYVLHVLALPVTALIVISIHYYKVAREHSISLPAVVEEGQLASDQRRRALERVDLLPDLLRQELAWASVVTFLLVAVAAFFYDAPLGMPADPSRTPLHTTAPWFFLWLQGLLKLGDPRFMGVIVPLLGIALLFAVPWLDRNPYRLARRRRAAIAMWLLGSACIGILSYMGTPRFAVPITPARAILLRFVPETEPGPFRCIPWEQLEAAPDGGKKTYFVVYPAGYAARPAYADPARFEFVQSEWLSPSTRPPADEFHRLLAMLQAAVKAEPRLLPPETEDVPLAVVTIEQWQPNLKWLEVTLTYDELVTDPVTQQVRLLRNQQEKAVLAIHRQSAYRP